MNEAVFRRYKRSLAEEKPLPQLIFIDGGKGQISAAAKAMQSLDLEMIPIVGLVKPPKRHSEISHLLRFGYEDKPVYFEMGVPVFRLVQQIRDETHKTAIEFHRKRPRNPRFHIGTNRYRRCRRQTQNETPAKLRLNRTHRQSLNRRTFTIRRLKDCETCL